jgi:CheY-like chemotaxis protein
MGKAVLRFAEVWIKLSCVLARLGCGTVADRYVGQPVVRRWRKKSAGLKLLLVEDEARVARFIKKGLTEEGHVVDVTARGIDAIALASVTGYDVIILDVMLPGKSGYHVASELRAEGNSTPILMLTARDSRSTSRNCLRESGRSRVEHGPLTRTLSGSRESNSIAFSTRRAEAPGISI